ncbi:MAG: TRAP transporter small permease [Deltaproteobacteria bacterium]|nr:TRAP transporter small permease [Deltaproteobacteria bacterium]
MKTSSDKKGILEKILFPLAKYLDRITWLLLFIMMMITVTDVFLRKFTSWSVLGSVELTEMMMIMVVFCSLAECQVHDGHIKVDLILKQFSPRVQSIFDIVTQFICFVLFSLMTWAIYRHANNMREWGEVTLDLALPVYPFVYVAVVGCGLLALVLLAKALAALHEVVES